MCNTKTILVVEDTNVVRETLKFILNKNGFEVWEAETAEKGLTLLRERGLPNIALVDLYLPKMDGFGLCKKILSFCDIPIIILSSETDEEVIVKGLNQFAEDYIVKTNPKSFRENELISRINRVMRHLGDFPYPSESPIIDVNTEFQVNFVNRKAFVRAEEVSLTPIESKLLHVLMRNAGQTVSYDFLIRRLWPSEMAFEDRLHTHVHRLRKKIEESPKMPRYILADWGNGYTFPLFSDS